MFWLRLNHDATVLLRQALAALLDMADSCNVDIIPAEAIVSISGNTPTAVNRALLRIPNSASAYLECDDTYGLVSFVLNLRDLHFDLSRAVADEEVNIHGDDDEDTIVIVTRNPETEEFAMSQLELTEAERNIPELDYQYRAIIGLPSQKFRHLIRYMQYFGNSVSVHATDTEVKFSALNEEVVYRTELGQCIIGGVQREHPVAFIFSLHFLNVILNACVLSNIVWLLQSADSPPMLNFAVGSIGNIMLYFPVGHDE
ncbi:proliferating cell nuclear antigen-like [Argentina anserina]|uniref:proliferating cell nuclear antigen-like n=1 Tax=Argentina anserina TaxID=57926 RepID=UPI002176837B|nr:proliferating cell nuclear antigen-like [Potentilla anserina]